MTESRVQDKKDAAAKGGRPHVYEYANPATVPTEPLYDLNEVVYMRKDAYSQAEGPFVVIAIMEGNMYKLKRQDNNQEYPVLVPEDSLLVPAA